MSDKKGIIILALVVALLIGGACAMMVLSRIPENPADATGNSAGNLYNNGLFCEDDGMVYFSNPYDGGAMYAMKPDESEMERIVDYNLKYINAEGDYIYYYQTAENDAVVMGFAGHTMGIYRCTKKGKKINCLDRTPSGVMALVGNYIYYEHYSNANEEGMTLYKVRTDKSDKQQVVDYIVDPSNVYNGGIYFASTKDNHDLYYLDSATDSIASVYAGAIWQPITLDGYVYYMNVKDDYKLYRYNMGDGSDEKLVDDRVDTFNVGGGYIFYQSNGENAALKRINLDGSDEVILREGIHKNINVTSTNVYFTQYESDIPVYKVPINNTAVTEFNNAKAKAIEYHK